MSKFVLTAQLQLQAPTNTQQVINQIRGQLQGAINIPVNVQGSVQATKQINQVNQAAQKATTAGERMGKAFGASIKRFAAFNIATRAVGLLASKLSQAVDESIKFQRELIKISQVTGKTTRELQGLTDTITNLSTRLGTSSTSLLQTGRILAQAGIQAGDLKVALEALAKTTLAPTFDDITETAEGAVAILAQFGEGVGALEKQLGAINAVAGKFAVESADLISVVRRTGGVFRQAGGDLNELLALFTSVRATTRENAESIATGLRTIFTRIQRPQTIEYLKQFGVQLTDLNGRFVGPYEAVRQLSAALAGLEQGDIRSAKLVRLFHLYRNLK
jgi:TP901 family phage tail tape measure protein